MTNFIMAMSINPDAKKKHPNLSHCVNESMEVFSRMELKVEYIFATLGRYDFLVAFEALDQRDAFKVASEINAQGIINTETWPVIPYDDFSKLLG